MNPEIIDNVNKPSHYQGANGLEGIEVIDNFIGNLQGKGSMVLGQCNQVYASLPKEKRS